MICVMDLIALHDANCVAFSRAYICLSSRTLNPRSQYHDSIRYVVIFALFLIFPNGFRDDYSFNIRWKLPTETFGSLAITFMAHN